MIASVLLILVAVVLLVAGLAGGSAPLLIISVAASLLAAVALVVGARQASGRRGGPAGPVAEPAIPHQHVPRSGGTGWRQPPGTPSGPDRRPRPAPGPGTEEPLDEPDLQQVRPEDEALVAQLVTPVHVVQGRPRYHLASCPHLLERLPSRIPVAEAVELGFTPCAVCAPATALRADARNS